MYGTYFTFLVSGLFFGLLVVGLLFFASPVFAVAIALILGVVGLAVAGTRRSRQRTEEGDDTESREEERVQDAIDEGPSNPRSGGRPASGEGSY